MSVIQVVSAPDVGITHIEVTGSVEAYDRIKERLIEAVKASSSREEQAVELELVHINGAVYTLEAFARKLGSIKNGFLGGFRLKKVRQSSGS